MFNFIKEKLGKKKFKSEAEALIVAVKKSARYIYSSNDLKDSKPYQDIKKLPESEQKELVLELNKFLLEILSKRSKEKWEYNSDSILYYGDSVILAVQGGLLRKKLNYTETEWINLFKSFKHVSDKSSTLERSHVSFNYFPINYAIKQIEYYLKKNELTENLSSFINEMLEWDEFTGGSDKYYYGSDLNKSVKRLKDFLQEEGEIPMFSLKAEDIGAEVNEIIASISDKKDDFHQIFNLTHGATNAKPPKKFTKQVTIHQDNIGLDEYRKVVHQILTTPLKQGHEEVTTTYTHGSRTYDYTETQYLNSQNQQFIKGMVWTMERFSDKETISILTKLCEKAYTKIPGRGPAAASIGNACVYVLGNMRGKDGLGALSRLKLKVRQNNVKKSIDKYLVEGAKKYNVSVEELKEMAVPDFKLEKGSKTILFDDYKLSVFIEGKRVKQQWIKPDDALMKSVPTAVKKSATLTNKLKVVRKEVKEIQKVFGAQKQRIDNQFILDRTWDFRSFQKYYLQNGLVYPITKQLIWSFTKNDKTVNAILLDDKWYTLQHDLIDWIDESTTVQLWHPVNADEKTIIDWREKMMDLEWKQPIKQAFREIYILTDAEVNTKNYSNRMAAHILKQHQFNSLANLRGWKYSLLGAYDDGRDGEICHKHLPEYGITAEYWIDELYQDGNWNDAGIWLYISTDQVKFKDANNQVMDLVNVPKIVFTEIMRDVDMFVGVCSVGNDPQWMDNNGERQANRDYWQSYSFGDLTEIAKTRKAILERLLPRLKKIRDKAHIDGKFLVIKGSLRTYKIHIGSGNILMEPNDQYLCIVPARSAENTTDRIFIPFEGDKGLSIVLSKAFLLAEDTKITDTTITSQINR